MSSNQRNTEVAHVGDERHANGRPTSAVAPVRPPQAVARRSPGSLRGAGLPRRGDGRHRRTGGRQQASVVSALSRRAYFEFVGDASEAFRLVFESDLRNEPAVRERVDRVERLCIDAITETIMADTGVSRARAELLAAGLVGSAITAAQFWLAGGRQVPKEDAEQLLSTLSWRGIGGFPLHGEAHAGTDPAIS